MLELDTKIKILVIRRLALGDVVMITPILRALHNSYTEIDVLTDFPSILRNNPYVNNILSSADEQLINYRKYDCVINLDISLENNPKLHAIDAYSLTALHSLLPDCDKRMEMFPNEDDKNVVNEYLSQFNTEPIIIHMRNHNPKHFESNSRNLPQMFWVHLLLKLSNFDIPIIQVGTKGDFHCIGIRNVHSAVDKFSLHQLQYLITKSRLVLCVDTGVMHIAGTTNTPIVALFTLCPPEIRKPFGTPFYPLLPDIDCVGCYMKAKPPVTTLPTCIRGDNECINRFSVDKVIDKVEEVLRKHIK